MGARAMMDVGVSDGRGCIIMSVIAVLSTILRGGGGGGRKRIWKHPWILDLITEIAISSS